MYLTFLVRETISFTSSNMQGWMIRALILSQWLIILYLPILCRIVASTVFALSVGPACLRSLWFIFEFLRLSQPSTLFSRATTESTDSSVSPVHQSLHLAQTHHLVTAFNAMLKYSSTTTEGREFAPPSDWFGQTLQKHLYISHQQILLNRLDICDCYR